MKKSHIIIVAIGIYLSIMIAGGTAYYVVSQQQAILAQKKAEAGDDAPQAKKAQKEKEKESKKKRDMEREKKKAVEQERRKRMKQLKDKMTSVSRGGIVYYLFPAPEKQDSGVFLRPFIQEGAESSVLKNDVFYYSSVEDDDYGWVHGDHLMIRADGWETTLGFDPSVRRDKLGSGAESVTEHFVVDAGPEALEALKMVGSAGSASVYFYQAGAAGVFHELGREEIRHIHDMVELYELMRQEEKGE